MSPTPGRMKPPPPPPPTPPTGAVPGAELSSGAGGAVFTSLLSLHHLLTSLKEKSLRKMMV